MNMRHMVALSLVLAGLPLSASDVKKSTEAANLGFAGPIKSVSSIRQTFMQEPTQPDGPTVIYPLWCDDCEFDPEGNRITNGTQVNGHFVGTRIHRKLDGNGRVREEWWTDEKGNVTSRHVYTNGPLGKTEDDSYTNGKLTSKTTYEYDGRGNVIESDVWGANGNLQEHHEWTFDGHNKPVEWIDIGPGNIYYHIIQTYDPQTGNLASFTSLNPDGSPRLWFTLKGDTVASFWRQPGDKPTYGSGICSDDDSGTTRECRDYNPDGTYSTSKYTFSDKTKHNPLNAALYDASHQLVLEADYEYEFDAFGNWTKRTVWVRTSESGERQLYERDTRTLTYYGENATPTGEQP